MRGVPGVGRALEGSRGRRRLVTQEEKDEGGDRVADVEGTVVVRVGRLEAPRRTAANEEEAEGVERLGNVAPTTSSRAQSPSTSRIATAEPKRGPLSVVGVREAAVWADPPSDLGHGLGCGGAT